MVVHKQVVLKGRGCSEERERKEQLALALRTLN